MPAGNGVVMRYFHWYYPAHGSLRKEVASRAQALQRAGLQIHADTVLGHRMGDEVTARGQE